MSDQQTERTTQHPPPGYILAIGTLVIYAFPVVSFLLEGSPDYQALAIGVAIAGVLQASGFALVEYRALRRERRLRCVYDR